MLISQKKSTLLPLNNLRKALLIALLVFLCYFLFKILFVSASSLQAPILCDSETVEGKDFVTNGFRFSNGHLQSDILAYRGRYSCRIQPGEGLQYGFSHTLRVKPGKIYKISVWRRKDAKDAKGHLVFSGSKKNTFYQVASKAKKVENGWDQLSLTMQVPQDYQENKANIYVYSEGIGNLFFDDLMIEESDSFPTELAQALFTPQTLNLSIKDKSYRKLQEKRTQALRSGVLITEDDSWVKARLQEDDDNLPIKMRLKGDWLDHLAKKKWSFRVKVKDPYAWNRLKTFSLQSPAARYFVLEWMLHQFWEREDVLTTRYDFVNLSVNQESVGIYAYEEHFDKQLLEYRQRREGPILRFKEDALWEARRRNKKSKIPSDKNLPIVTQMNYAEISPFKENQVQDSEVMTKQYNIAQNLLYQFQQKMRPADEIFDVDKMARFQAISDVMGSHHNIVWHNMRFYYNPIIGKLEPIGFDGFSGNPRKDPLILGKALVENEPGTNNKALIHLYENEAFLEQYMFYLDKFTQPKYLFDFLNDIRQGLNNRLVFLNREFPNFKYSEKKIIERAKQIRVRMLPYSDFSVQAHWKKDATGNHLIRMSSTHEFPLQVIGTGRSKQQEPQLLDHPVVLAAFRMGHEKSIRSIEVPRGDAEYLFYRPYGLDTLFYTPISTWEQPSDYAPMQAIFQKVDVANNARFEVIDQDIIFPNTPQTWDRDVVIPAGYRVYFSAGSQIDLIKKAKFISYSPVFLNGTSDAPIYFKSSDKSANGFSVFNAKEESKVSYTSFADFNTLNYRGWTLTGAVTFYESDVSLKNVVFKDAHCEDALNIIRSKFDADEIKVDGCFSDGFDADFCQGTVKNSSFINTGNDGMDFSGSQIFVVNCHSLNSGDKGISVGEESNVTLEDCIVENAVIGVASKDLSYLRIKNIDLINCNQGFVAYQKKAEYGRSTIFVERFDAEEVKYLHTIAPRCTLELAGKLIIGE